MRNDVSIPPEESDLLPAPSLSEPVRKEISTAPIPPPDDLKADVALFDHPNLSPGGAGNFWLLGMIGFGVGVVVLIVFWMLAGLMK